MKPGVSPDVVFPVPALSVRAARRLAGDLKISVAQIDGVRKLANVFLTCLNLLEAGRSSIGVGQGSAAQQRVQAVQFERASSFMGHGVPWPEKHENLPAARPLV